jgi:threonine dehydratase
MGGHPDRPGRRGRVVARPTNADLAAAAEVVRAHLAPTPVLSTSRAVLKLETVQPTGSFKVRGALAAVAAAAASGASRVIAASAGNHGLGVAWAATRLGIPATIVVPATASTAKVAALERFDVTLIRHGTSYDEAEAHALGIGGGAFVSPYNDTSVIAGQATIAAELIDQVPDVATIVVPVGGGGLVSGIALACAAIRPHVRVVGVEAAQSCAMRAAHAAGRAVPIEVGPTLADGLAGNMEVGSVTVDISAEHVAAMLTVDEDQIAAAMRWFASEHGLVVEGSGAVGMAAVLAEGVPSDGPTVVIVTGRNVALDTLARVLTATAPVTTR